MTTIVPLDHVGPMEPLMAQAGPPSRSVDLEQRVSELAMKLGSQWRGLSEVVVVGLWVGFYFATFRDLT